MDKTEKTIKAYNASAHNFQTKFMDLKLYKNSFEILSGYLQPDFTILDPGCGPGNVTKYLLEKETTLKITGIDLSEEMIKLARKNVPGAEFECQDIRKINFENNQFDMIIAAFCLPYLYNEEAADFIKKTSGFLKNGGILYVSTMEGDGNRFETTSFCRDHEMFFNYYNEDFLLDVFKDNNLNVEHYIRQEYPESDGSVTVDMIFILKKTGEYYEN